MCEAQSAALLFPLQGAALWLFGNSRQNTSSADHGEAGFALAEAASQRKIDMRSLELITRAGRATELPFRIEAEMDERPVVLNLSPSRC